VSRNDDEMITLGGGEVDEMELLMRRLKGANNMVEELPVVATDEDETPKADEPVEIVIGGQSGEDDQPEETDDTDDPAQTEETEEPAAEEAEEAAPVEDEPIEITLGEDASEDDEEEEADQSAEEEAEEASEDDQSENEAKADEEPAEIVIGGDDSAEQTVEAAPEAPVEEKKTEPKKAEKKSKKEKDFTLPAPVIGPRDLDKMRAARAEAKKHAEDVSFSGDEQDFEKHFLISASPHLHCGETTRIVMQDVVIALLPALGMSFVYYGWRALMLTAVCVLSCVLCEYVCRRVMNRRQTISDFSAVVTGILLAFCLPPELNPLFAVVGSVVAIAVVKQMFGGIGNNFANPAATARIVLMLSFPAAMTTFSPAFSWMDNNLDTVTSATPLAEPESYTMVDLLLGVHGGSLGEVCAIALLLGGGYLLLRGVISWHIPVAFIGTAAVLSLLLGMDPLAQICSGGLLLGAFFMATDYVTSPVNKRGQIVFGIGCGLLTMLIRRFGAMAEGVSFAILLMNILTPHIERVTTPKPFGEEGKEA